MIEAVQAAIAQVWRAGADVDADGCFALRGHPDGLRFGIADDVADKAAAARDWLAVTLRNTDAG